MTTMLAPGASGSIPTRPSLLARLKSGDDARGWEEFYRTYGGLIRAFALKAGLTEDEAEDVVQETAISVARNLPGFTYDPVVCAFKTWLLNLTTWRIRDRLRQRHPGAIAHRPATPAEGAGTDTVERVPDPAPPEFGAEWDAAFAQHTYSHALETLKTQVDLKQFQIFDLYVIKGWSALEVARAMGVNLARVYLTKHRLTQRLKQEVARLEKQALRASAS